jgi:peptidoglycan hydrolase-like protein with peptidoglycan-binding domain
VPSRGRRDRNFFDSASLLGGTIMCYPREFVAIVMAVVATLAIVINALFLQQGPHPAPIFAARLSGPLTEREAALPPHRPAPAVSVEPAVSMRSQAQITYDIQRELVRRGYYDGAIDGIWGAKTAAAAREFVRVAGLALKAEPSEELLRVLTTPPTKSTNRQPVLPEPAAISSRDDQITKSIAPSKRVIAIQRALAEYGYGQIKSSGVYDQDTRTAIEEFQRDRKLPVDGQVSNRFVHELAAMTGRPLEK